jgi:hypothetical protein
MMSMLAAFSASSVRYQSATRLISSRAQPAGYGHALRTDIAADEVAAPAQRAELDGKPQLIRRTSALIDLLDQDQPAPQTMTLHGTLKGVATTLVDAEYEPA